MSNSLGSIRGVVKNSQKCIEINSDIADVKGNLTVSGGDLRVGGSGIEHIKNIYGVTGETTGTVSLSDDGTIFAIAGPQFDGNGMTDNGRVRIFKYNGTTWTQLGNDIYGEQPGDKIGQGLYGGLSLSGDGFRVAIASAFNTTGGNSSQGQVRIFEYNQTDWIQLGDSIYGVTGDVNYEEAMAISLSGDGNVVAIGCAGQVNSGLNGKVRVFEYTGTAWSQLGSDILGPSNYGLGERGVDLSNNGTILSAGAWRHDNFRGCVRIYQYNGGSWSQLGSDIVGPNVGDNFAENSLSGDGTIVAIGGINHDSNVNNTGIVQVYKYIESTWTQIGSNIYGDEANDGLTRPRLSKDGNTLLVSSSPKHGLPVTSGLRAHHSWSSFVDDNTWEDLTGNGHHATRQGSGTVSLVSKAEANTTGFGGYGPWPYINGDVNSRWDLFGGQTLNSDYTIVYIMRYDVNASHRRRIIDMKNSNYLIGAHNGYIGKTYQGGWINYDPSMQNTEWVLGIDMPNRQVRRGTVTTQWADNTGGGSNHTNLIATINNGQASHNERSDYNIAEIIYYNRKLTDSEINDMKTWLMDYKAGNIHVQYPFSSGNGDGYVKLFENIDSTWTEIGKITGDPNLHNNGQLRFGMSSALSGDGRTFAAGSPYADIDNNTDTGISKIYQYNKKGNLQTGRIQFFQTNTEVAGGDTASILNRFNTVINIPTTDSDGNALTADTTYEMTTGPAGSINNISFVKKQPANSKVFMCMKTNDQTGNIHAQTISAWKTPDISYPNNMFVSYVDIFRPPRDGYYLLKFNTSLKSTTGNSTYATIRLKKNGVTSAEAEEAEANDQGFNPKHRFLSVSDIIYITSSDTIRIDIQADNQYRLIGGARSVFIAHNVD